MSQRIVLLGVGQGLELSASDASACIQAGMTYASMTMYAGPLADATVLMFEGKYLDALGGREEIDAHEEAWKNALALPRHPRHAPFPIETPIPLAQAEHNPDPFAFRRDRPAREKIKLLRSLNRVLERALILACHDLEEERHGLSGSANEKFEDYLRRAAIHVEEAVPETATDAQGWARVAIPSE